MSPLFLMMLAAQAVPSAEQEIVVVGRRFDKTEGEIRQNVFTGGMKCVVSKTSGDAAIDKAVCDVALACMKHKKLPAFHECVTDGRTRFLEQYFAERQAKQEQAQ